jgi:hypothetical protein
VRCAYKLTVVSSHLEMALIEIRSSVALSTLTV